MTPELARIAFQFLERTDLKGAETDAMYAVRQALMALVNQPQPSLIPIHRSNGAESQSLRTTPEEEEEAFQASLDHSRRKQ